MEFQTTAFILAGGRSTRMGTDKAFLRFDGPTLLEHAIALAKAVCDSVVLVGHKKRLGAYGVVIEDKFSERGPLAGIHAALTSPFASERNLLFAVDTPAIPVEVLQFLLNASETANAVVTVPRANGFTQPLCAVYRTGFAAVAEASLQSGRNKIDPLFAATDTHFVEEDEIRQLGYGPDIFANVNTPEDWQRMQQKLGARR